MEIITLNEENLGKEHICCAISNRLAAEGVKVKKEWLKCRMPEGLVFKKMDAWGKIFIEYIPAKYAWLPLHAPRYVIVNCLWVSGTFKGHGYAKQLLAECEEDIRSQGYFGIAAIVGDKKRSFLSDKDFFLHHGYEVCDACPPFFELVVKRFNEEAEPPRFKDCAHQGLGEDVKGIDIFYTAQCPFTIPYAKLAEPIIAKYDYPVRLHHIEDRRTAQNFFAPVTTYCAFIDGQFYTNEILTPPKLEKLIIRQRKLLNNIS